MSFWSAVVLIVAISAIVKVFTSRHAGHLHHQDQPGPRADEGYTRELEREVADLRERVKVLERIATDKSVRLADEIESLRD